MTEMGHIWGSLDVPEGSKYNFLQKIHKIFPKRWASSIQGLHLLQIVPQIRRNYKDKEIAMEDNEWEIDIGQRLAKYCN